MHEISEEQRFLFDLQGYLILRGAIDRDLIDALDAAVVENEAKEHDESWAAGIPVVNGQHFSKDTNVDNQIRLNGLPRLDPVFDQLNYQEALAALCDCGRISAIRRARSRATEAATTTGWRGWTTRVGIRRRRRPSSCSTSSRAT